MDNFNLKKFLGEKSLLNESAPGYDTRKFGEALPTLESVKAAYEAKNLKEEGRYEDTNKLFQPPEKWDVRITKWIDENQLYKCLEDFSLGTKDTVNFSNDLMVRLAKL